MSFQYQTYYEIPFDQKMQIKGLFIMNSLDKPSGDSVATYSFH
jgi:hypothetical protein